jgi:hypothetical protein
VTRRLVSTVLLLAALVAAAGCGGGGGGEGKATLWVTRDRGAQVLLSTTVPAGESAMRALRRAADVETGYGGRFVRGIEGLSEDSSHERDWFYFVNGIEADRSAAEYRLRPGDVLWWDYRSWSGGDMRQPVVVGAFPEPFLHGYDGHVRIAVVRFATEKMRAAALGLANTVGAKSVELLSVAAPAGSNVLEVLDGDVPFTAAQQVAGAGAGSPVIFRVSFEDAKRLLCDPHLPKHRYQGLP